MKVVVLTTKNPGLRNQAHLWTLNALGLEMVCLEVSGFGVLVDKITRQLRLIPRKGLLSYLRWRSERFKAAPLREATSEYLAKKLAAREFANFRPPLDSSFSGFSTALVRRIEAEKPDFVIQMGVGIIPAHFIRRVPPILNLHPGILPGIRGLDPMFWAHYYAREDWFGSTLHFIDDGIDTGKPLLRRRFSPHMGTSMADSICAQIEMEMELLRIFFTNYPNLESFDQGGGDKSVYKSTWSVETYRALEAAGWWGPIDQTPQPQKPARKSNSMWSWQNAKALFRHQVTK